VNDERVHIGVELGGTKVVVAGSSRGADLNDRHTITTRDPVTTFIDVRDAITEIAGCRASMGAGIAGIGIASFGPIDLRPGGQTYGHMLATPKPGWSGIDVLSGVSSTSKVPVALDTDVNAAVLGEHVWGSATADNAAYMTVGTGIGGGIWSAGQVLHGSNHPEIGHLRVPRHPDDVFAGSCPFHGDCLEGMASGTALKQRWGVPGEESNDNTGQVLEFEAWYLAHGIAGLCCVVPVEQVIIGGGVARMSGLHAAVAAGLSSASGLYPAVPFADGGPEILPPGLGDDAGVVGAIELARRI